MYHLKKVLNEVSLIFESDEELRGKQTIKKNAKSSMLEIKYNREKYGAPTPGWADKIKSILERFERTNLSFFEINIEDFLGFLQDEEYKFHKEEIRKYVIRKYDNERVQDGWENYRTFAYKFLNNSKIFQLFGEANATEQFSKHVLAKLKSIESQFLAHTLELGCLSISDCRNGN